MLFQVHGHMVTQSPTTADGLEGLLLSPDQEHGPTLTLSITHTHTHRQGCCEVNQPHTHTHTHTQQKVFCETEGPVTPPPPIRKQERPRLG